MRCGTHHDAATCDISGLSIGYGYCPVVNGYIGGLVNPEIATNTELPTLQNINILNFKYKHDSLQDITASEIVQKNHTRSFNV